MRILTYPVGHSDGIRSVIPGIRPPRDDAAERGFVVSLPFGSVKGFEARDTGAARYMFLVSPEVHRKDALAAELSDKSLNQWAEEVLDRAAD